MLNLPRIGAGLVLSAVIGFLAYRRRSLTASGWLGAIITGTATFGFGGWAWGLTLIAFFVTSSLLSHVRRAQKERATGETFEKGSQRDLGQALANGGIASVLALLYAVRGEPAWLLAAFVGVMATVTADTWATELGVLSRRPPVLITTLRRVEAGTSGGVSGAGLAASAAGALLVGLVAAGVHVWETGMWQIALVPAALVGGLCGSLTDSLFGATVQASYRTASGRITERTHDAAGQPHVLARGWRVINNDAVNALSSVLGGVIALGVWQVLQQIG